MQKHKGLHYFGHFRAFKYRLSKEQLVHYCTKRRWKSFGGVLNEGQELGESAGSYLGLQPGFEEACVVRTRTRTSRRA